MQRSHGGIIKYEMLNRTVDKYLAHCQEIAFHILWLYMFL